MRTLLVSALAIGAVLLLAPASNAASLSVTIEAEGGGSIQFGEFDLYVYATVTGGAANSGVAAAQIEVYSAGSVDLAVPKEKSTPPNSGKVETTWSAEVSGNVTTAILPLWEDYDADGDKDAKAMAFADGDKFSNLEIGITAAGASRKTLIATQRWICLDNEPATLTVLVRDNAMHYSGPGVPDIPHTFFSSVSGGTCEVNVPEPATIGLLVLGVVPMLLRRRK